MYKLYKIKYNKLYSIKYSIMYNGSDKCINDINVLKHFNN